MRRLPILMLAALCLAGASSAAASTGQRVLFEAPRELLGADAGLRTRTLGELRDLGVRDLRIVLYWKGVAPQATSRRVPGFHERDPRAYDWGAYGAAIDAAKAAGFRVLLTVSGPVPVWATARRRDDRTRPSPMHFRRFFEAVARRFGGAVDAYSVWNEPNHPDFLLPQFVDGAPASGRIYRKLYLAARHGLKAAGQQRRTLLFGETAPRGTTRVVAPLQFLRQALCVTRAGHRRDACNRIRVDGIAHHPYTTKAGPLFVPPDRDDVTIGVLPRLARFTARAERARAITTGTRVWLTEFGIQSLPDPYVGVSFTAQAESRSIGELLARRQSRVASFAQYLLRDDAPREGRASERYAGFETGLRRADGDAKRALEAFRLPLVVHRHGSGLRLWGLVRPARGRTTVEVQQRAGSGAWRHLTTVTTTVSGSWAAHVARGGTRRYRVRWRAPEGVVHTGPATRIRKASR